MQTFIVKLVCICLFGFIFYSAYLTNGTELSALTKSNQSRTVLVANKLETKSFTVERQETTHISYGTNYINFN